MFDNYEIIEKRKISDLNSEGYILCHKKTKAYVTLLLNDDENKVFYIGFRTPPKDSTGVAHILEHSVLCGSKKFPVKDPFIELAKGSLNTFLNAMTYPDKTVYPVASCNDKDFHNLVDVYLDAVFNPNIYREEKIFKQEGHHYEMDDPDGELKINGVVYSEMKGVYSSPDSVVGRYVENSLYPDMTYGLESGGDPDHIPELTYEEFLDFHGRYYHPSNSFIFLYGDLDAKSYLKFIDEEYLSKYEYLEVDSEVGYQKPFDAPRSFEEKYPVLDPEDNEGTYLTYNICMGDSLDKDLYIALDVLEYVLCSSPGAIIKQELLDNGIGDDVTSTVETGIYQPYFSITVKGASVSNRDRFVKIIEDTLSKTVKEGLPEKALRAALNHFEFRYREADFGSYPRGLMLGLQALDSWLYDKKAPFIHIEANDTYAYLKENINKGYFEDLIQRYFIDNPHRSIVTVSPESGLTAKKDEELKKRLQAYRDSLSKEQIEKIVKETKELKEYQSEPSPREDLLKIPMLQREDLKKEAYKLKNEELRSGDTPVIFHDVFTNGIAYVGLYFNIDSLPMRLWPYAGLLRGIISLMDTDDHGYNDLFNEINIRTGGIYSDYRSYPDKRSGFEPRGYVYVKAKALYDGIKDAFELTEEIISSTHYDDYKRLNELLLMSKVRMQSSMMSAGHQIASVRALSYIFKQYSMDDITSGLAQYRFICDLTDDFESKKESIAKNLYEAARCIFRPENLTVSVTCEKKGFEGMLDRVEEFRKHLYTEPCDKGSFEYNPEKKNEAFITSGQVQFVCRAGDYKKSHLSYNGALRALKVLMGYDYLWNNVRVLGGAYGCFAIFGISGACYFVSYRDPNLDNTIEVYDKASEYIKGLKLDERSVLQYIIGALSELDVPQTPSTKGAFSFGAYISGLTEDDFAKERDELLNVNAEKIRELAEYIDSFMQDEALCVVGNADAIRDSKAEFGSREELL